MANEALSDLSGPGRLSGSQLAVADAALDALLELAQGPISEEQHRKIVRRLRLAMLVAQWPAPSVIFGGREDASTCHE